MRVLLSLFTICALAVLGAAQAPVTGDQVIRMSKAGLPDDVIIAEIRAQPAPWKPNPDELIALKSAGVSDAVIRALLGGTTPVADPAGGDPNNPLSPHDPGVYILERAANGQKVLTAIDRAGSNHAKTANVWAAAFTYGIAKAKYKAELPGDRAATRSGDARPEFYMYFPATGTLGPADTISSPSQFVLLALEVKKERRETTIAKEGFASASMGADEKKTFKFTAEKVRPYVYKIVPEGELPQGEYAWVAGTGVAGSAGQVAVVIFDFGVDKVAAQQAGSR